jgi:transposase InsO family protein
MTATPADAVRRILELRLAHPRWGAEMIRLELMSQQPMPSARTIRRHLQQANAPAAPPGRPSAIERPRVPRAVRPHQGWQVDAAEEICLHGPRQVCWLQFVDECSGAFLKTTVFPTGRWEHVDRYEIQEEFRRAFAQWGRPGRLRVDNGYPWGSSGDLPAELALWLLGLGIEMIWNTPGCPQQNGVVERSQGTCQNWTEPETCRTPAELQRHCDRMDRRQREQYPYRDGSSRWEVYPELKHSGQAYSLRWEGKHWDLSKALAILSETTVPRHVDASGSVTLYHHTHYVGKPHIGTWVYVSLDPTGPTWVFSDERGNELRTHAAAELTAECIRGLRVSRRCAKAK